MLKRQPSRRVRLSGCGGEAVAAHHCCDRREVGRTVGWGVKDRGDLAEVVGAEDARGDDRERLGIDVVGVVEVVDRAAVDAERLTRADVDRHALDRPG